MGIPHPTIPVPWLAASWLLSWGARGAWQPWGTPQTRVSFRPHWAGLTHSPGGPGEPWSALWARGSHLPRHPIWSGGTGVSLGSTLSLGAGLPKAALGTLEAREALQAQGAPLALGAGESCRAGGSLWSR